MIRKKILLSLIEEGKFFGEFELDESYFTYSLLFI